MVEQSELRLELSHMRLILLPGTSMLLKRRVRVQLSTLKKHFSLLYKDNNTHRWLTPWSQVCPYQGNL